MKEFKGKIAVVTGAASGIGRAIAERCIAEGMKVVAVDIEEQAMMEAAKQMAEKRPLLLEASNIDVSDPAAVEGLASSVFERHGTVHLLFNNAGVAPHGKPCWAQSLHDWKWVIDVNLYGVINGLRSFVPRMLAAGEEGHIVNTASVAGLLGGPMISPYYATKHAVVGLSEALYLELSMIKSNLSASVLCPAFVKTRIAESGRNRPGVVSSPAAATDEFSTMVRALVENGISPESVADKVFVAIREDRFWILTHPEVDPAIRDRAEGMLAGRNPVLRPI